MKSIAFLSLAFCLLIFVGCKTTQSVKSIDKDEVRFYLSKGACFGQCPSYTLTVFQNRKAVFHGKTFTEKLGIHERTLSKEEFKALENKFEEKEFKKFEEVYNSSLVDLPLIEVGYNDGTGYSASSGRDTRPNDLNLLQIELEKVVDRNGWTMTSSPQEIDNNRKPEVVLIKEEVIIEPDSGLLLAKWIEAHNGIGVRLIKRIAPGLNYYLITYDSSKISGENFLQLLKDDAQIKTAEFNKKTARR